MKIAIIGCGYIGSALAIIFSKMGHIVTATTKSPKKLHGLANIVQRGIVAPATDEKTTGFLLEDNDIIIVTVASPSFNDYENTFLNTSHAIRSRALKVAQPKKLIYTSNCSVYGEQNGQWVDENTTLNPITTEAEILLETEKVLCSIEAIGWKVSILRLCEIYGPGRELSKKVKNFSGKNLSGDGSHFTNMVHQQDVIGAIDYVITHKLYGIYNLADDDHPSYKDLYQEICNKSNLPAMKWNPQQKRYYNGNKRVSNHKIKSAGFTFQHPHRIAD